MYKIQWNAKTSERKPNNVVLRVQVWNRLSNTMSLHILNIIVFSGPYCMRVSVTLLILGSEDCHEGGKPPSCVSGLHG